MSKINYNDSFINTNVFITGTDTEVGKTYVACRILHKWRNLGYKTIGLKPISSGHSLISNKLVNEDAYLLQKAATEKLPLSKVNPFSFPEFIAPHIAAEKHGVILNIETLFKSMEEQLKSNYDYCLVEGCGGWHVPIDKNKTMADFAKMLGFPVVLVVSIKLGCINHAILTYNSIKSNGVEVYGWVANCMVDMEKNSQQENIKAISNFINAPLLAIE